MLKEAGFKLNNRFLSNCLTHVIFVQNEQLLQRMGTVMKDLTTRAFIFANGRDELIYPGIEGQVLNAASSGIPVVVLHHTGGAAEKLGMALQERKKHKAPMDPTLGRYQIPDNVNVDNFLLLSTSSDSVEKVIDKLTLVLSSVQVPPQLWPCPDASFHRMLSHFPGCFHDATSFATAHVHPVPSPLCTLCHRPCAPCAPPLLMPGR